MSLDLVLRQAVPRGWPGEISTRVTHPLHATCNRASGDERGRRHRQVTAITTGPGEHGTRNPGVTEIKKMPNGGHALTIDHGWQEVAQTALDFVKRFVPAKPGW